MFLFCYNNIVIKPNLKSKPAKYLIGVQKGKSKKQAALDAGYALTTANHSVDQIEQTQQYCEVYKALSYKDELLKKTTLGEIADEQLKVVFQDRDLGAKNMAIKQTVGTIEPEKGMTDTEEQVLIILK